MWSSLLSPVESWYCVRSSWSVKGCGVDVSKRLGCIFNMSVSLWVVLCVLLMSVHLNTGVKTLPSTLPQSEEKSRVLCRLLVPCRGVRGLSEPTLCLLVVFGVRGERDGLVRRSWSKLGPEWSGWASVESHPGGSLSHVRPEFPALGLTTSQGAAPHHENTASARTPGRAGRSDPVTSRVRGRGSVCARRTTGRPVTCGVVH